MKLNVSVIIPVYNAEAFLEKAVNSCLQFPEVEEILLIDDGSKDNSLKIAKELAGKHPKVKTFQHPDAQNHGVSATRNLGIDKATQEFIAFLDADDYWLPNRFDAERKHFKDPKIDGVFGGIDAEFIGEEGKTAYIDKFGTNTLCTVKYAAEGMEVFNKLTAEQNNFGTFFSMIALTVKKNALEKHHLRINERLSLMEDKEFILRLAYHSYLKTGIIDEGVAMRTTHLTNSITGLKNYSKDYFRHNGLLYRSLYLWGQKQKKFPKHTLRLFKLKYLSSQLSSETGLTKYFRYFIYLVKYPELLKTRYRHFIMNND